MGMKMWVLTGDKLETAINIAQSCYLLDPKGANIIFDTKDPEWRFKLEELLAVQSAIERNAAYEDPLKASLESGKLSLTVSGDCFARILDEPQLCSRFFKLALNFCVSVIACRLSPKQKAELVRQSREVLKGKSTRSCILAIGDGGNDVQDI